MSRIGDPPRQSPVTSAITFHCDPSKFLWAQESDRLLFGAGVLNELCRSEGACVMNFAKVAVGLFGVLFALVVLIAVFAPLDDDGPERQQGSSGVDAKSVQRTSNISVSGYSHTHITGNEPVVRVRCSTSGESRP